MCKAAIEIRLKTRKAFRELDEIMDLLYVAEHGVAPPIDYCWQRDFEQAQQPAR